MVKFWWYASQILFEILISKNPIIDLKVKMKAMNLVGLTGFFSSKKGYFLSTAGIHYKEEDRHSGGTEK